MNSGEGREVLVPVGAGHAVFVITTREDGRYSCRCPICQQPANDVSVPPLVGWCHFHGRGHDLTG